MLSGKTSANSTVIYYLAFHIVLGGVCFKSIVPALNYKEVIFLTIWLLPAYFFIVF